MMVIQTLLAEQVCRFVLSSIMSYYKLLIIHILLYHSRM